MKKLLFAIVLMLVSIWCIMVAGVLFAYSAMYYVSAVILIAAVLVALSGILGDDTK